MGGENEYCNHYHNPKTGSSPRGRGKLIHPLSSTNQPRLIPAWAGKTSRGWFVGWEGGAHPRVGGENVCVLVAWLVCGGSSPRGRGKRVRHQGGLPFLRLIPAWAGKTSALQSVAGFYAAHPRVGGENEETLRPRTFAGGSSPRGRGKHPVEDRCELPLRLIPAWAGKTLCTNFCKGIHKAHPRVGGENYLSLPFFTFFTGSSPRGRGKLS